MSKEREEYEQTEREEYEQKRQKEKKKKKRGAIVGALVTLAGIAVEVLAIKGKINNNKS